MSIPPLTTDKAKSITLKKGDYLFQAGDVNTLLYYVVSGCLQLYILDQSEERIIRFGYKGSYICALDSLITHQPTVYYLQAIRQTEVMVPSLEETTALLNDMERLKKLVMQFQEREIDLLTDSPIDRYRRVLHRSPTLFQEVPQKYIARYLRMTPETFSRLKKLDLNQDLQ
ncbi:Crp/Fnr family transcriptional regulator [Myroides sp. N17-2]|uniref:Crp/Fnr family transcriptional regulator n=1 Tax=Myroides sp. N17-2 TaxID=2030799 RepID=UPI000EFDB23B|nr:Crp/Fnr family transcriptional regulator [Myroides sp. N17-2]